MANSNLLYFVDSFDFGTRYGSLRMYMCVYACVYMCV